MRKPFAIHMHIIHNERESSLFESHTEPPSPTPTPTPISKNMVCTHKNKNKKKRKKRRSGNLMFSAHFFFLFFFHYFVFDAPSFVTCCLFHSQFFFLSRKWISHIHTYIGIPFTNHIFSFSFHFYFRLVVSRIPCIYLKCDYFFSLVFAEYMYAFFDNQKQYTATSLSSLSLYIM